jgi:transcriptional regulator with XRE-family HTH domain
VAKIAEIIKRKGITQTQAAALLQMPQPELSNLLSGRFRGVSERRLMSHQAWARRADCCGSGALLSGKKRRCRRSKPPGIERSKSASRLTIAAISKLLLLRTFSLRPGARLCETSTLVAPAREEFLAEVAYYSQA